MPSVNMNVLEESRRHQVVQKYEIYPLHASDIKDYQIKLTGMASNIKEDARIIQDGLLDQWVESISNVWSKLTNLKAKTPQTVIGLSGNPSSKDIDDIDATMIFGDDFPGISLDSAPTSEDVVVSADAGKYEAWPGIAEDSSGNLYVVYRTCDTNTHTYDATGRVVIRKSTDNGNTWGSETIVSNVANIDDKNPNILIFDDNGTETFIVVYNSDDGIEANSRVYVRKSIDGGSNWGNAIAITPGDTRTSRGTPILLSNNKILIPIYNVIAWRTYIIESSDAGDTWIEYNIGIDTTHHITETSIIETKTGGNYTGGIYAIMRSEVSPYTYYKATSSDYGHTWSAITSVSDIANTYRTPISLYRAPNGEILGSRSDSNHDIVIHESNNECGAWTEKKDAVKTIVTSTYPQLIIINDTKLILVWCDQDDIDSEVFVNFMDYPIIEYKWTVDSGAVTVSNGKATLAEASFVVMRNAVKRSLPLKWRTKVNCANITDYMFFGMAEESASDWSNLDSFFLQALISGKDYPTSYNDGNYTQNATHIGTAGDHIYDIKWKSGELKWYYDDALIDTFTTNIPNTDMWAKFDNRTGTHIVDWVAIMEYVSPEPVIQHINKLNRASLIKALGSRL